MRKILTAGIMAILLCSALAVIVQAQSTPTTSIVGVNVISSTKINNSTFDKLTVNESMAVAQNAIDNYLSGKTKTLVIPGGTVIVPAMNSSSNNPLYMLSAGRPVYSNMTISSNIQRSQVSPMYTSYTLPSYNWSQGGYTSTYVAFGGAKSYPADTDYGANVSSITAAFNYAYPNTFSNLGLPGYEELVMHLWGWNKGVSGGSEDDLVFWRDASNHNMIDIDFVIASTQKIGTIATVPQTDEVTAYITAMCPIGSSEYNQIQMCVYDATTRTWYRPATWNTPVTQLAHDADVALECKGNFNPCQWKVAENFVAYNVSQGHEDLLRYGHVTLAYTPDDKSPAAENMYYFDPSTYIGVPNAEANIFITRYVTGSSPPAHP